MRCPFCSSENTQVKDSRASEGGNAVRRRRQCGACAGRFTTFERVQLRELSVRKTNGEVVAFDRDKLRRSVMIALQKRPVEAEDVDQMISGIVRQLESRTHAEVASSDIGELLMDGLARLDSVGYVRYASVYRDFRTTDEFKSFIGEEVIPLGRVVTGRAKG